MYKRQTEAARNPYRCFQSLETRLTAPHPERTEARPACAIFIRAPQQVAHALCPNRCTEAARNPYRCFQSLETRLTAPLPKPAQRLRSSLGRRNSLHTRCARIVAPRRLEIRIGVFNLSRRDLPRPILSVPKLAQRVRSSLGRRNRSHTRCVPESLYRCLLYTSPSPRD